jgi:chromosome partitioning protein
MFPRIIACTGMKGGVGKSTVAINLAATLMERGRSVLLVDADAQQTASIWVSIAQEAKHPAPTLISNPLANLHKAEQLPRLSQQFDHTIIDGPPRLADVQVSILMVADLVLYPCGPSGPELWALRPALEEFAKVRRQFRPNLMAAIVLNRMQPHTTQTRTARRNLEQQLQQLQAELAMPEIVVPILEAALVQRIPQSEALSAGLGVTTYYPDSRAAAEVNALVTEILNLKGAPHGRATETTARDPQATERRRRR